MSKWAAALRVRGMGGAVEADRTEKKPGGSRHRLLLRGESAVASIGIALAALLLAAMAASSFWIHTNQRAASELGRAEQAQTACALLAQASERLLAQNDLTAARTLLSQTARDYRFSQCEIVLPDGRVLAAMEPAKITQKQMPREWPEGSASDRPAAVSNGVVHVDCAMDVPGRGRATVQIAAPVAKAAWTDWQTQAGVGAIGAVALFVLLLIYRRMRARLQALGAIREALLLAGDGGAAAGALSLSADLGPEAAAWNHVVADIDKLRKHSIAQKAREALGRRQDASNDLESACDALPQGLLLIDDNSRIKYANGAAAVFLRGKREELIGADVGKFVQIPGVLDAIREVAGGSARRRCTQDIERQQDGAQGVFRFSVRPVRRDDSASAMLTIEDITQQKVAEEARHSFVAQATHELRTPLTNIRLYVETAIEEGENDPATRAKCLNVINGETRRLERIVGEMLSVAEIEAGSFKLNRDDVRLDSLLADLEADYRQAAAEKQIQLNFHLPPKLPTLQGDRDKLTLALHNLVGNAIKYTEPGGKVTVNVNWLKGRLTVDVQDTGIGISPDDQQRVFDRFYRAHDPRVAKITGTGLGLTLAREVARLHNGDITLESEIDRGSTFTFSVPAPAEAA